MVEADHIIYHSYSSDQIWLLHWAHLYNVEKYDTKQDKI